MGYFKMTDSLGGLHGFLPPSVHLQMRVTCHAARIHTIPHQASLEAMSTKFELIYYRTIVIFYPTNLHMVYLAFGTPLGHPTLSRHQGLMQYLKPLYQEIFHRYQVPMMEELASSILERSLVSQMLARNIFFCFSNKIS